MLISSDKLFLFKIFDIIYIEIDNKEKIKGRK